MEWLDPHSGLTMRYQMLYGPADCSVEMVRHEPEPTEIHSIHPHANLSASLIIIVTHSTRV